MEPTDLTIEVLKGIRDEVRKTNEELRNTNEEVRKTNERVDALASETKHGFEHLGRRQTETEIRLATELVGVAGAVREVRDLLRDDLALRNRVDDHERRITAIEKHPR